MKAIIKIAYAAAFAVIAATSCKTETVYVYPDPNQFVSRLNVYPRSVNMSFVDNTELSVTIRPSTAKYTWTSSDPSVAYVDKHNKIVPLKTGNVDLTVSAGDFEQTIPVRITSAIVGSSYFIESGKTEDISSEIKVLPEGTPFTITSNDPRVFVNPNNPMEITATSPGSATLTVSTFDGISKKINVGVVDPANVVTMNAATAYYFPGSYFDLSYNMEVLAMTEQGRTYNEGGSWSGSGRGLALKMGHSLNASKLPNGVYEPGSGEGRFFTDNYTSYVYTANNGKEYVTGGKVEVTDNGIKASVTTASNVYIFNYEGQRTDKEHIFEWGTVRTVPVTDNMINGVSVVVDHNGTIYYAGYTKCWDFTFNISGKSTKLMIWSKTVNNPEGSYTLGGFCEAGTYMGSRSSCTYPFTGSSASKTLTNPSLVFTISNFNRAGTANTFTADFIGQIGWSGESEYVSEVNLSRTYDVYIDFQLKNRSVSISRETSLPN